MCVATTAHLLNFAFEILDLAEASHTHKHGEVHRGESGRGHAARRARRARRRLHRALRPRGTAAGHDAARRRRLQQPRVTAAVRRRMEKEEKGHNGSKTVGQTGGARLV